MFWRGALLDGDGAQENQDTFWLSDRASTDLRRNQPYLTVGGAMKKDKLWYFLSFQYLDNVTPVSLAGASFTRSDYGHYGFGKVTWQVNSDNKLAFQVNDDPRTIHGIFLGFGVEEESDGLWKQGGTTPQIRWTSIISPTLLLETLLTHYDAGISVDPVSPLFHRTDITTRVDRSNNQLVLRANYPLEECSINGTAQGFINNCDASKGKTSIYQINALTGTITGPLYFQFDD
jgi:hypothetical protein